MQGSAVELVAHGARQSLSESAIRDTVDRVFQAGVYNQTTPLQRGLMWLGDVFRDILGLLGRLLGEVRASPALSWTALLVIVVILVAITARLIYLAQLRRIAGAASAIRFTDAWLGGGGDPLAAAEREARAGNFTPAAHALYAALLGAIARQHQIKVHHSKTVGDYGRELRAKGSSLLARYREFGRTYETVIYGVGSCDRERFDRLYAIAAPILRPNG